MNSNFIPFLLAAIILLSCSTTDTTYKQHIREIKYFQSRIHNIDRNIITLSNGTKWKTNRFVIAVNMTDVFFVVNFLGNGHAYINGTKYSVSHEGEGDVFRYFTGYYNILKTTHNDNIIIELSDGTHWKIINAGDVDIKKWLSTSDIIISENENIMINPYRIEAIGVTRIVDEKEEKRNI